MQPIQFLAEALKFGVCERERERERERKRESERAREREREREREKGGERERVRQTNTNCGMWSFLLALLLEPLKWNLCSRRKE